MPKQNLPRLAVLIDADNASPKVADELFEEIATLGQATIRRIYGDFSSPNLKSWSDVLPNHAIIAQQQFANTKNKNASDIALVIDAMDILHEGRVEGFCLVSSDSDFTRLASRIREQGISVYGFGERKTPDTFIQACHSFIFIENLLKPINTDTSEDIPPVATKEITSAIPLFRKAIEQIANDDGYAFLSQVGAQLKNLAPDFDQRNYGFTKLRDLMEATNAFSQRESEAGNVAICFNPQPSKKNNGTD